MKVLVATEKPFAAAAVDGDDDWSVYTKDGKASAQWEIQVLVTEDGHEVLSW